MVDPNIVEKAAAAKLDLQRTLGLARQAEDRAHQWKAQLQSNPPANEPGRQHYRGRAVEFRRLHAERLQNMEKVTLQVADLIHRLDALSEEDQVVVLRQQIGSMLEGQAATARALASVLEICLEIDRVP